MTHKIYIMVTASSKNDAEDRNDLPKMINGEVVNVPKS